MTTGMARVNFDSPLLFPETGVPDENWTSAAHKPDAAAYARGRHAKSKRQELLTAEEEVALARDIELGSCAEGLIAVCAQTTDERLAWRGQAIEALTVEILRARHNHSKDPDLVASASDEAIVKVDGFIELAHKQGPANEQGVIVLPPELAEDLAELVRLKETAFARFWRGNQGLVRFAAAKKTGRGVVWDELVDGVATGGLLPAIGKFDYARGLKFSTYAVPWLGQAATRTVECMAKAVAETSSPEQASILRTSDAFWQECGRYPTAEEVALAVGLSAKQVEQAWQTASNTPLALDAATSNGCSVELADSRPGPEEAVSNADFSEVLREVLAGCLPHERRKVLELRLGIGRPEGQGLEYTAIGSTFGYSEKWARDNFAAALDVLRYVTGQKMENPPAKRQHKMWRELNWLRATYGDKARLLMEYFT
jgi:RNA polymerase sigma factor (sigma-70 family)